MDGDEHGYTLLIDGSWLDAEVAIRVGDELRASVPLANDAYVRIRLDLGESLQLWQLLDANIGAHWREGQEVRKEVEEARRQGLDTKLVSREEYEAALRVYGDPLVDPEEQAIAESVVKVYERAHGFRRRDA